MHRLACILLLLVASLARADSNLGLRVPAGFQVSEYADSRLADNIFSMTCDPRGRIVVSGPGYLRILVDSAHRGRAERAIDFASGPRQGAQGMLWENGWLYYTADGGLRRYRIGQDGDHAAGPSELIAALHTGGEHDAHAIRRGPDGWLYLICGNMAGVNGRFASLPTSPIRTPSAGAVVRFRPDLKASEIVADGFRNPYDMDFSPAGDLFTFDSDNERCVALPWYEPTRFYHVLPGGHYGWRAPQRGDWWRLPPYLPDVVQPVSTLGRGSPTGVACYRGASFPSQYDGGFFLADWTFGRIYFARLQRAGSSWTCRPEVFLEAVGDNGFAPTALVVQPQTGDLFIAIGGRGTRGAVYRVHYTGANAPPARASTAHRSLAWSAGLHERLLARAGSAPVHERLLALELIRRHRQHFQGDELLAIVRANWDESDRYLRQAAARLACLLSAAERQALYQQAGQPREKAIVGFSMALAGERGVDKVALAVLGSAGATTADRMAGVRLLQLAMGGVTAQQARGIVWEGYTPRRTPDEMLRLQASPALRDLFPSGDADLDRELSRTLAMIMDPSPELPPRICGQLTQVSDPVEDEHYLFVLARLPGPYPRALTKRIAAALVKLDAKLTSRQISRDSNWPLRISEAYRELLGKAPGLAEAIVADPGFGSPAHAVLALAPEVNAEKAAPRFLVRAANTEDYQWTPTLVQVFARLPAARAAAALRPLWGKAGLDDLILPILCRHPQAEDSAKFLQGLNSPSMEATRQSLTALEQLGSLEKDAYPALIGCLHRLPSSREADPLRRQLVSDLQRWTRRPEIGADPAAWTVWLTRTYPSLSRALNTADGVDMAHWQQRLGRLDWSAGEVARGQGVFVRARCASCHSGAEAMGPDLRGVAARFSRADLLTAILLPSRDISDRYRTLLIETHSGKSYQGIVVYESTDGVLLQTEPGKTVRIRGSDIEVRRYTKVSMMPAGLLDKLTDRDIGDLYAYLRGLGRPARRGTPKDSLPGAH